MYGMEVKGVWKITVLSSQFCCKAKTSLIKSLKKNRCALKKEQKLIYYDENQG